MESGGRREGIWFIGDYAGDIGTYAFCLMFAKSPGESYRLLDRLENMRMALLSVAVMGRGEGPEEVNRDKCILFLIDRRAVACE